MASLQDAQKLYNNYRYYRYFIEQNERKILQDDIVCNTNKRVVMKDEEITVSLDCNSDYD